MAGYVPLSRLPLLSPSWQGFYALWAVKVAGDAGFARALFLTKGFARHVSPLTTTVYTYSSDQEMWEKVRS